MASLNLSIGTAASGTQNVNQNDDTVTFSSDGWAGGSSWSSSTSNCTISPNSGTIPTGQGNVTVTISNFTRSASNGSYSVTISGNRKGGANTSTAIASGTIAASTGSITLTPGSGDYPEGSSFTYSWSTNDGSAMYYNSTGTGGSTNRFSPKDGQVSGTPTNNDSGGSGSFGFTANSVDLSVANNDGSWTGGYTLRVNSTSGSQVDNTGTILRIYKPVALGTISLAETSRDDTDGSFILQASVTGAETINGFYPIEYRFRRHDTGAILQGFGTTSSYTGTGDLRGVGIQVQHRIVGNYNSTGGSGYVPGGAGGPGLIIPQIAADTTFTASSPTISWDAATFDTTLTGVQIGDQVQVTLNSDIGVVFEDLTTITSTTQVITCNAATVNSTNLPYGQATTCRVRVLRPTSTGGDGVFAGNQTFTVTRNYRAGPFASVSVTTPTGASATIGAQAYNAYDIGQKEPVRVTGSGVISGATYIGRIISGTTQGGATSGIIYNQTASGTEPNAATTAGGCEFSQLPTPGNSCSYRITCIIPTSLGGDGTTEHACSPLTIYVPTTLTEWTFTRSNYVTPNLVTGPFSITGVFSTASANTYVLAFNDTADKSWTVSSTQTNQVYKVTENGTDYDTFGTGNSSLSGTFLNSDIPVTDGTTTADFFLETAVPTINDGTGVYSSCTESGGTPLVFAFLYREPTYTTPTINAINAVMETSDLSKIVPYVQLTDAAGNTTAYIDFVWSTTTPNPTTGWFNPAGGQEMTGYHSANFSLDKFSSGSTTANYTVYFGVRARSDATGATTTANYTSFSVVGANYVLDPGGGLADGYLNRENEENNTGNSNLDGYIQTRSDILLEDADTLDETVRFESLSNPSSINTAAQSDYRNSTTAALFTVVSPQTQYLINVISGTTQGGTTQVGARLLALGNTSDTYTLSNPSELPTTGNTTVYKFYRRQLQNQGGDGTLQVPAQASTVAEFSARRRTTPDDIITVTVPDFNLTPSQSGDMTITIADGNSSTEYQIRAYAGSDANSDSSLPTIPSNIASRTGDGTLTIPFASLPAEGDTISYKMRYREAGSGAGFADVDLTSTNKAFNIGRLQDFTITDDVPNTGRATNTEYESNTITLNGISQALGTTPVPSTATETVQVRQNSGNNQVSWALSSVNGGTFDNTDKTVEEGDTLAIKFTTASSENTARTIRVTFTNSGHTELWTLTTGTNTGTGSGGGGSGTGAAYGLIVNNSSGNNLIDGNSRVTRFVDSGSVSIAGEGTTSSAISVPGLTATGDDWTVVVTSSRSSVGQSIDKFSVNRGTGSFTITNNTDDDGSGDANNSTRLFNWKVFKSG